MLTVYLRLSKQRVKSAGSVNASLALPMYIVNKEYLIWKMAFSIKPIELAITSDIFHNE